MPRTRRRPTATSAKETDARCAAQRKETAPRRMRPTKPPRMRTSQTGASNVVPALLDASLHSPPQRALDAAHGHLPYEALGGTPKYAAHKSALTAFLIDPDFMIPHPRNLAQTAGTMQGTPSCPELSPVSCRTRHDSPTCERG